MGKKQNKIEFKKCPQEKVIILKCKQIAEQGMPLCCSLYKAIYVIGQHGSYLESSSKQHKDKAQRRPTILKQIYGNQFPSIFCDNISANADLVC